MSQSATRTPAPSRTEDIEVLKNIGVEPTNVRDVDNAIAKYAKRMGGQIDAIKNYRDAMLQRAQSAA